MNFCSLRHFPTARRASYTALLVSIVGASLASAQLPPPTESRSATESNPPVPSTNHGFTLPGRDNLGMSAASKKELGWPDRRFVTKVTDAGHADERLAQLATQRAKSPEVRRFAERLVEHHKLVNAELRGIASNRNVSIETEAEDGRVFRRLMRAPAEEFDREFISHFVDQQEKDVTLFERASRSAHDVEIRTFAAKHLPQIREHYQQAHTLLAQLSSAER